MTKITRILVILFTTFYLNFSFGQDHQKYLELVQDAMKFYQSKEFFKAGQKFSEAFVANGNKGAFNDRYNAACSWSLANVADSAFVQLYIITDRFNYYSLSQITQDTDFNNIHADKRWDEIITIVKSNKEKKEINYDKPIVAILDTVFREDQQYRQQLSSVADKHGWDSPEIDSLWKIINEKDSINLNKVKKILDEKGWLGSDVIGGTGNETLFLVIQHSDQVTQEKYLPMMKDAVKMGNADPSSLALLEDRIALGQGKRQIYGSQIQRDEVTGIFYVLPLEDPINVDKRRETVGLGSLQDYVSNWGIVWNVEEYIKKLPEIEAKQKKNKIKP